MKKLSSSSKQDKGQAFELQESLRLHVEGTPLLLSSLVLREYGCGQVDVAVIKNDMIKLYELKAGAEITKNQWRRLQNTAHLVSAHLEKSVSLVFVQSNAS